MTSSSDQSLETDTEYNPFVEEPSTAVKREIYMDKLQQAFRDAGASMEISSAEEEEPLPAAKRRRRGKKGTGHGKVKRTRHTKFMVQHKEQPEKEFSTMPTRNRCDQIHSKPADSQRLQSGFLYPVCLCADDESCERDCPFRTA